MLGLVPGVEQTEFFFCWDRLFKEWRGPDECIGTGPRIMRVTRVVVSNMPYFFAPFWGR